MSWWTSGAATVGGSYTLQRILDAGQSMAEVVPVYIKEVHTTLDILEQDMKEFYDNIDHPVVQEMLRRSLQKK